MTAIEETSELFASTLKLFIFWGGCTLYISAYQLRGCRNESNNEFLAGFG